VRICIVRVGLCLLAGNETNLSCSNRFPSLCDFCSSPCQGPIFNPTVLSVLVRGLKIQSNHPCIISSQPLLSLPRCGTKSAFLNVIPKTEILPSPFCQADRKSSQIRIFCLSAANQKHKDQYIQNCNSAFVCMGMKLISQIEEGT